MSTVENSISGCLHTYEVYRIPKGTKVQNAAGEEVVLSEEEDTLVLTKESSRQLVKDRRDYGDLLQTNAEMAAEKTQDAARKKIRLQKLGEKNSRASAETQWMPQTSFLMIIMHPRKRTRLS